MNSLTPAPSKGARKHYHLVAGQVLFKNKEDEVGSITLNAIVTSDSSKVPVRMIGRAQQALQMNFHKRMEDPSLTIFDVVVLGLTHCGHMTDREWNKAPDGTQLQEISGDSPFTIN